MITTPANHPTHRIYAVTKGRNGKSYWKTIGAAWAHQDGEGFGLHFDLLPLNGAQIVIRKPKPVEETEAPALEHADGQPEEQPQDQAEAEGGVA